MALPNFRGQSQFRTWLYRIATNVCYNRMPRLRREIAAIGDDHADEIPDDSAPVPGSDVETRQRQAYLHQQIDTLPESYKILVTLRYQQEMSYDEIATVLSLPLGTVKTGLFRAKAQLRESLRQYEDSQL
jgi:RNA polymerase sigma-70 factor (ECF subfamily)